MTTLRVRSVHLEADTALGQAGFDLEFSSGLNILRADNSSGKSTCLQAIIYALGLEGMLSARRDVPLPSSMTHHVELQGRPVPVSSSRVRVVIENQRREVLSVERVVKDDRFDRALIRTLPGAGAQPPITRDFFVRRPGAAKRADGFHFYLASYLGWYLPRVTKTDGSEAPLYLESLFPYFYVEQKHGWSGVQARLPTYLGIREVGKRSAEFLLALDVYEQYLRRQRLASVASELERDWRDLVSEFRTLASQSALVITDTPDRLPRKLDANQLRAQLSVNGQWTDPSSRLQMLRSELETSRHTLTSPPTDADVGSADLELESTQAQLAQVNAALLAVAESLNETEQQEAAVQSRIEDLEEDLQRHKDAAMLVCLGSQGTTTESSPTCPTCHQEVTDGHDITSRSLTVEQNVSLIEKQLDAFRGMRTDSIRQQAAASARLSALREDSRRLRRLIRGFRRTLEGAPSEAGIARAARVLALEIQVEQLETVQAELAKLRRRALEITTSYDANRKQLSEVSDELTDRDKGKLKDLSALIQAQLSHYQLTSVEPSQIELSHDTYRPVHDGFDLGFDLSASDMIRAILAYLMAMLQVGYGVGNHVGLLILDEPRQQDTARSSYQALIQEATRITSEKDVQIIFATSEESETLRSMVPASGVRIIDMPPGQKLLKLRSPS